MSSILSELVTGGKIYLLILLLLWLFVLLESSKKTSKLKKVFCIITSVFLCLFVGFRWETGTDWSSYKLLFDTLELNWTFLLNVYHFDIGYVFVNAFVRCFTDNYTVFLILNSGITFYLLSKLFLKLSPNPNLSLFFFYCNFMIAQFMGSNRRMMAMAFTLWGFYYVYCRREKVITYYLTLAFIFHRSSLVNILSFWVPRTAFSLKQVLLLLFISFCIGLLQLPAKLIEFLGSVLSVVTNNPIVEKMVFYSENNDEYLVYSTGDMFLSTALAVIKRSILLAFYVYVIRRHKIDKLTLFLYNIYVIGFVGYLLFIGSFFQMLTAYWTFVEVILIGRMYAYTARRTKQLFCLILLFYGLLQMISALNVYPELYIPYLPFWTSIHR